MKNIIIATSFSFFDNNKAINAETKKILLAIRKAKASKYAVKDKIINIKS